MRIRCIFWSFSHMFITMYGSENIKFTKDFLRNSTDGQRRCNKTLSRVSLNIFAEVKH